MSDLIDISVGLKQGLPSWPGSAGFELSRTSRLVRGVSSNNSRITCDVHTGTHIDAPWHFVEHGRTVDNLDLGTMIGETYVADVRGRQVIDQTVLEQIAFPAGTCRVLFRTDNSALWNTAAGFREDYVALSADAALWLAGREMQLVGIDYLSIQRFNDPPDTHEILLENEIVILEGICLDGVEQGVYELMCLPLKLVGSDGAPARAVLRRL